MLIALLLFSVLVTGAIATAALLITLAKPVDEMTAMYRWMDGEKISRREARVIRSGSRQRV